MSLSIIFVDSIPAKILDTMMVDPTKEFTRKDFIKNGLSNRSLDRHLPTLESESLIKRKTGKRGHRFSLLHNDRVNALIKARNEN